MANKTPKAGDAARMAKMRASKALRRAFEAADWPVERSARATAWLAGMVARGLAPDRVPAASAG